jgi:hypothetical protein
VVSDPVVRRAMAVASQSLFEQLARTPSRPSTARRWRLAVLRYLIRMSTRPTPYGFERGSRPIRWSSCGPAGLSCLSGLAAAAPRLRSRYERLARGPRARAVSWSSDTVHRAGRCPRGGLPRRRPSDREAHPHPLREGLLVSELRPPLTGGDPARCLLSRLDRLVAARVERDRLAVAIAACERWQLPRSRCLSLLVAAPGLPPEARSPRGPRRRRIRKHRLPAAGLAVPGDPEVFAGREGSPGRLGPPDRVDPRARPAGRVPPGRPTAS